MAVYKKIIFTTQWGGFIKVIYLWQTYRANPPLQVKRLTVVSLSLGAQRGKLL
jgi:hypothetical protein